MVPSGCTRISTFASFADDRRLVAALADQAARADRMNLAARTTAHGHAAGLAGGGPVLEPVFLGIEDDLAHDVPVGDEDAAVGDRHPEARARDAIVFAPRLVGVWARHPRA